MRLPEKLTLQLVVIAVTRIKTVRWPLGYIIGYVIASYHMMVLHQLLHITCLTISFNIIKPFQRYHELKGKGFCNPKYHSIESLMSISEFVIIAYSTFKTFLSYLMRKKMKSYIPWFIYFCFIVIYLEYINHYTLHTTTLRTT